MEDKKRLKVLVHHWIEHNTEHEQEFRRWAEKAESLGDKALHNYILAAAQKMQEANVCLSDAAKRLEEV